MTKKLAILFDLDDTLLVNDMDHFLPGYIDALVKALPQIPADRLQKSLMTGTKKMLSKKMPADTLEETFNCHFYPKLGVNQTEIQNDIVNFYQNDFPKLKYLTKTRPESGAIIENLSGDGHAITIATSPLFPSAAQYHRLHWAGISNVDHMIDDVTSFENYHFCKPHTEYFIEVILKNHYTDLPVVMIGNSLSDDIIPCEKLGIPTYWVTNEAKNEMQGQLSSSGELSGVSAWIADIIDQVKPIQWNSNQENTLSLLKTTPTIFEHFGKQYYSDLLINENTKENNSITKILRHVLEGDKQLNIPRIRQFYEETKPVITGIDLDTLSDFSHYANNDYCHLLSKFIEIRTELLELITKASPETMAKKAMHTIFGPTSFSEILQFIAIHDLSHINDCYKLLNSQLN